MHHYLESYAYRNALRSVSPTAKAGLALGLLVLALVAQPLTQGIIVVWLARWTVSHARIPWRVYGGWLGVLVLFWLLSLPALVIQVVPPLVAFPVEDVWLVVDVGDWQVFLSHRGVYTALTTGLRSLACSSCLLFLLFTTPFSDLLQVLRCCRLPPLLLDVLLLMYRLIFLLLGEVAIMYTAQQARGGYRNWPQALVSLGLLTGQLWLRTLRRYEQLALGLAARGWQGHGRVSLPVTSHLPRRYVVEALVGGLGLLALEGVLRQ
ncbi:MAG: cobalt ECF transporter T component CbiQ [Gloeomargarita sp. GMQP_bins_120]